VDGNLVSVGGVVPCTITGGTGRFAGATGTYDFAITAIPLADGSGAASPRRRRWRESFRR
jgi:hypothetical protein